MEGVRRVNRRYLLELIKPLENIFSKGLISCHVEFDLQFLFKVDELASLKPKFFEKGKDISGIPEDR